MICKNCNQQISEESLFCPYCGSAVEQPVTEQPIPEQAPVAEQPAPQPISQPAPAPQEQYQQPTGQYQQAQYQQPQSQQFYPNPVAQLDSEVDSAKTLGIVALIGAFVCPLVSYICGGIGLSKVKKLKPQSNEQQAQKLKSAKNLCTAGIIVHTVLVVLSIVITIVFSVVAVKAAEKAYDALKDNPNFNYNYENPDGTPDIPDEYKQFFE